MLFSNYISNPKHYKKHKNLFKHLLFKKYPNKLIEIDDLYSELITQILVREHKGVLWDNDKHCENYLNLSINNKITVMLNKKTIIYEYDIDNFDFAEDNSQNVYLENENEIITSIKNWMEINLTYLEKELFRTWYYNNYTYDEISKIYMINKITVFNIIKKVKQKLRIQFQNSIPS